MRRQEDYHVRYGRFSSRIERFIVTLIIASTITLIIGQSLYSFDSIRQLLVETERWEGKTETP